MYYSMSKVTLNNACIIEYPNSTQNFTNNIMHISMSKKFFEYTM